MKQPFWIIIIIAAVCIGCRRQQPIDHVYGWPASGDAVADSLLLLNERNSMTKIKKDFPVEDPGTQLCSLAVKSDNPVVKFRGACIEIRRMLLNAPFADVKRHIDSARQFIDSASNPFDWHISQGLIAESTPDRIERYILLRDNLKFYRDRGCRSEEARTLNDLGSLFSDFSDYESAYRFFSETEQICREESFTPSLLISKMNRCQSTSDSAELIHAVHEMINDSAAQRDDRLMLYLLHNYFIHTDSIEYLNRGLEIIEEGRADIGLTPEFYALKGEWLLRHGKTREGMKLTRRGYDSIHAIHTGPTTARLTIVEAMANAYALNGLMDSSVMMWCLAKEYRDSIDRMLDNAVFYGTFFKEQTALIEHNAELERSRQMWAAIALTVIIVAVAAATVMAIRRREGRRRLSLLRRVRRSNRMVVAQKSVLEENEKLIESISASVKDKTDDIGPEVSRLLRLHQSNKGSRESIIRLQTEVHEDFLLKLRSDFPALTEGQLRLAALIVSGADSHLIASILNIAPLSVNVNRHRLRMRLRLKTEDSLEDFLRRYNSGDASVE